VVNDAPYLSEQWLALEFVTEHAKDLRYTAVSDQWNIWTGTYWRRDEKLRVFSLAQEMCRRKAKEIGDGAARLRKTLSSAATRAAVVSLAREHPILAMHPDQWDADPWLLGTPSGTVDLRTGLLRAPLPEDYISLVTAVTPGGDCPIWRKSLLEIFGTEAMVKYHQRIAGYCATGSVQEEKLFILAGTGRNGKGTFIETVLYCLGAYGTTVAMSTLMQRRHEEHPAEIAKLYQKRLAVASEQLEDGVWNTARIKTLTGGDRLTARFMRMNYFDFDPTHKLVVSTNTMPSFGRVDTAIKERILKSEFRRQFLKGHADKMLKEKLRGEAPGILAWIVEGCSQWWEIGLQPPSDVVAATEEYLSRADDVRMFIDDECTREKVAAAYTDELWKGWVPWCERNGTAPGSRRAFTERIQEMFPIERGAGNRMKVIGLQLRNPRSKLAGDAEVADPDASSNPEQPGFVH
jgi:putative DNA primase/helicase